MPELAAKEGGPTNFRGVFIRAPAILEVGPEVQVLAEYPVTHHKSNENNESVEKVAVAVKQGNLLGMAFHPELTADTRWHSYFLKMVSGLEGKSNNICLSGGDDILVEKTPRIDLPIYQ